MLYNSFADYVVAKRAETNITRSEMSRRAGVSPQYGMGIERGIHVPSVEVIENLVRVLDMDEKTAFKLADKIPSRYYEEAKRKYFNEG